MSYNYYNTILNIRDILIKEGFPEYSKEVLDSQLAGSTSSEIILRVCSKLLEIKKKHPQVYEVIESEADELIDYANSVGLYPK